MPVVADLFEKFFKAKDFDPPRPFTIISADREKFRSEDDEVSESLVLRFKEDKRGLVIKNKTSYNKLVEIFGNENTDAWIGGCIEVYFDPDVTYKGKKIGGARIRPASI